MYKKITLLSLLCLIMSAPAYSQHREGYYRSHTQFLIPFIGGMIAGGIINRTYTPPPVYTAPPVYAPPVYAPPVYAPPPVYIQPARPICWQEVIYYDIFGRPVYQTVCR